MTCLASRVRGEALETAGLAPGPWVLPLRHQKPDLRAFRGEGMVPGKGFEPLTFGLQNRCTTAVLTRQLVDLAALSGHQRLRLRLDAGSLGQCP